MKKEFFDYIGGLRGVTFVGLRKYANKSGEIANHTINVGCDYQTVKTDDLATLKGCTTSDLLMFSTETGIAIEAFEAALSEMIVSAEKNLSDDPSERTNQSQAQTDAYIHLGNGLRLHKESMTLHIWGLSVTKKVLVAGEYKAVKSADKTIAKKVISKRLKLRAGNFRSYIIGNISEVRFGGKALNLYPETV